MNRRIPYARQSISEEDIEAVVAVLRSDFLTQGPAVGRFEQAVAGFCGARHAVAVSSATAGLHLACVAAGLGPGDLLWTSPNTFVASANCARFCGADVDFVDIDPRTLNMSVDALEEKLRFAKSRDRLPAVVLPVHFAGQPCDVGAMGRLAKQYGFKLIEDASHAVGASRDGARTGACRDSLMTVFSFHPVKIATTGEGGAILTNDDALAQRLCRLRAHGVTRDARFLTRESDGPWYYEQIELGFNYRLTDIQAALGTSQLARVEAFVRRRQELARRYDALLAALPLVTHPPEPAALSAHHLYAVRVDPTRARRSRREVYESLREKGVDCSVHYLPVHLQPYYHGLGFAPGQFPQAERYYREALTLPLYYGLDESEQDFVVETLTEALLA